MSQLEWNTFVSSPCIPDAKNARCQKRKCNKDVVNIYAVSLVVKNGKKLKIVANILTRLVAIFKCNDPLENDIISISVKDPYKKTNSCDCCKIFNKIFIFNFVTCLVVITTLSLIRDSIEQFKPKT